MNEGGSQFEILTTSDPYQRIHALYTYKMTEIARYGMTIEGSNLGRTGADRDNKNTQQNQYSNRSKKEN